MIIAHVEDHTLAVVAGTFAASIAAKGIERHFDALTHFPDRRANAELDGLAARLNDFAAFASGLWEKGEVAAGFDLAAEIEAFARRHIDLTRRYWSAESRCMNWFITGPARFPVARNDKRMRISDARRADLDAHSATARKAVRRKAFPHGAEGEPIRLGDPSAIKKIGEKIAALVASIDQMKTANAIIRRMEKDGADNDAMVAAIVARTGMSAAKAMSGVMVSDWQWKRGFDTTGSRAEIRRLQARLRALARIRECGTQSCTIETGTGRIEIVENADMARIQLRFPGKPDSAARQTLKANGFRWSPSQGVWQRHLNEAGKWAAQRVVTALAGTAETVIPETAREGD